MMGWAADIKVPGYSSTKVKNLGRRLGAGGVGYYPNKGFTHLDVGKSRYWVVKRAPRRYRRPRRVKAPPARSAARKAEPKKTVRKKAAPPRTASKTSTKKKS